MKYNYRGWRISFALGRYEARKYGGDVLIASNRVEIERKADTYENERENRKQSYLVEQDREKLILIVDSRE